MLFIQRLDLLATKYYACTIIHKFVFMLLTVYSYRISENS